MAWVTDRVLVLPESLICGGSRPAPRGAEVVLDAPFRESLHDAGGGVAVNPAVHVGGALRAREGSGDIGVRLVRDARRG
jgi:hypothetical protein